MAAASELEAKMWTIEHQWHRVTDEVRELYDGGWRSWNSDGGRLEQICEMSAEKVSAVIEGLEALEALDWIRTRAAALKVWAEVLE